MMDFTEEQSDRYSRHILLSEAGPKGQAKIMESKVLIIGLGGLGSASTLYLAAAGVGTLGIADGDSVDMTNLQRQVIHFTPDIDKPKVVSAKEKIEKINPDVNVVTYQKRVDQNNILDIIKGYDFIIDATDNFSAKFLINDACVIAKKPYSHGGVVRFGGQTLTYVPGEMCYRCVFDSPPPEDAIQSTAQVGVLGAVAGTLGTMQATQALKFIIGNGKLLINRMLIFDALNMDFRTVEFKKNINCPVCGKNSSITSL